MKRLIIITGLALVFAGSASAATTISPKSGTSHPYQEWIDESTVPTPDWELEVREYDCPFVEPPENEGMSCSLGPQMPLYISPTAWGFWTTFLHEMGHQFDYYELNDTERARLMTLINGASTDWRIIKGERFAEAWHLCARKAQRKRDFVEGAYGYRVRQHRHRVICRTIRRSYDPAVDVPPANDPDLVGCDDPMLVRCPNP